MTIGERIKARREELNITQDELAKKIGYKSRSSINKIELNQSNLRQSKIKQIADALDTTPGFIMGWEQYDKENHEKIEQIKEELSQIKAMQSIFQHLGYECSMIGSGEDLTGYELRKDGKTYEIDIDRWNAFLDTIYKYIEFQIQYL